MDLLLKVLMRRGCCMKKSFSYYRLPIENIVIVQDALIEYRSQISAIVNSRDKKISDAATKLYQEVDKCMYAIRTFITKNKISRGD